MKITRIIIIAACTALLLVGGVLLGKQMASKNSHPAIDSLNNTGITPKPYIIPQQRQIDYGKSFSAYIFVSPSHPDAIVKVHLSECQQAFDSVYENQQWRYIKKDNLKYTSLKAEKNSTKVKYYKRNLTNAGHHVFGGIIEYHTPDGKVRYIPFEDNYTVNEKPEEIEIIQGFSADLTKMNTLYIGVDNPIDINVPGIKDENISASVTNGSISHRSKAGSFIIHPRRPGNSILTVTANINGKRKNIGRKEFRVKRIPNPIAMVGGKTGGGISKNVLLAQVGVAAEIENFEFDCRFRVTEFTVAATIQGYSQSATSKSYKFTQQQKGIIRNLKRGQKVYIENIKAVGPDRAPRSIPAIALLIN